MQGTRLTALRKLLLLATAAFIEIFASCGRSAVPRCISVADSLTAADPRAAIAVIDSAQSCDASRSTRMKLALLKAKARNKLALPQSKDTLLLLGRYYRHHGTANDRMLLDYILGWAYYDAGNTPMALDCFSRAAEQADTTAGGCDYATLHKVHVHAAGLLLSQDILDQALTENQQAYYCALKARDTLNALITLEQRADVYYAQGRKDAAFALRRRLYTLYLKHGYGREAATSLGPLIEMYLNEGKTKNVEALLHIYETRSQLFDSENRIRKGYESYYSTKGYYYICLNRLDLAEFYLKKGLRLTQEKKVKEYTYRNLVLLYRKRHSPDSVAKYARLALAMNDSINTYLSRQHARKIQDLYNFHKYKAAIEAERSRSTENRYICFLLVLLLAAVMTAALRILRQRRKAYEERLQKYNEHITRLLQLKRTLEMLSANKEARLKLLIEEKETELREMERLKLQFEKRLFRSPRPATTGSTKLMERLITLARKELQPMSQEEAKELQALFDDYKPLSEWRYRLKETEYLVCLLVKLDFTPSDLAVLLHRSKSDISNIRKRLLFKMTGREGSSKDFDKFIKEL